MLEKNTEIALVKQLQQNDDAAFEVLVRHYGPKLLSIVRRFLHEEHDAQECLQKVFIQVFTNIHSFREDASLATWLHRIAINSALMMLRAQKKRKSISLDDYQQHYNEYGERTVFSDSENNNIASLFEQNESNRLITKVIYNLPEKYCNVLLLRDIQELSTKETAEILAISEASVKTTLHRARLLLKNILTDKQIGIKHVND